MAISVVGTPTTSDVHASGTTSIAPAVPAGVAAGDVLVAWISTGQNGAAITAPAGWTKLQAGHDNGAGAAQQSVVWLGYRIATASEPASYTWTFTGVTYAMSTMARVTGVNTTSTPVRASAGKFTNTATSALDTGPALSGVQPTDGVLYFWALGDNAGSTIGSFTDPGSPWARLAGRANGSKGQYATWAIGKTAAPTAQVSNSAALWTASAVAFVSASGADTTAPSVPGSVTATANSTSRVTVSWAASTDAGGTVASYRVMRNGVAVAAAVSGLSFVDSAVSPGTAYSYTVSAVDPSGNRSAESTAATVTTPAGTPAVLSIAVTAQPTNVPPRIQVNLTDARTTPSFALTVLRNNPDGTQSPVRTPDGNPLQLSASGATTVGAVFDYEAPFGQAVTYTTLEEPTATSAQATVDPGVPWLIHPGVPGLSMPIDLRVGSLAEETYGVSQGIHYPMGRANPVMQTDGARHGASSSLVVAIGSLSDLTTLRTLIADAGVVLLNIPAAMAVGFDPSYIAIGEVRIVRLSGTGSDPLRDVTLPFDVVDAPIGGSQAQRTWVDLLGYSTWAQVQSAYPTWGAVLAGP